FSVHPRRVLRPEDPPVALFAREDLRERLQALGVDCFIEQEFNSDLAKLSPDEFLHDWLGPLNLELIVVGPDFRFGSSREGDFSLLGAWAHRTGVRAIQVPAVMESGEPVSSSRIRLLLSQGEVAPAATLLGRSYYHSGYVVRGAGRGRGLGVPTANVFLSSSPLRRGVYVTRLEIFGQKYPAISNLGVNPTFLGPDAELRLETHIFDWDQDIYGELVRVEFVAFLRDEKKFSGLEELKTQILRDIHAARRLHGIG
ncbi:MAG: riboflavin biosynthesis protein RibF, partial [Bdellovibrionaceae bacterium]|nr:riboflavin biosynthesis protein RibF [Pseudobdellovibrionaceae bacterium]